MRPTSFRGAAACDGLFELAQDTFPTLLVLNGPRVKEELGDEVLMIGWDPNAGNHVVATRGVDDLCGRMAEFGEIACYIGVRSGNSDIAPVRNRAVEIVAGIEAAIRDEREALGANVDEASVGTDLGLTHYQDKDGASVGLAFTVSYVAYI